MSFIFPFYATQIIHSFLNSRISANHDKVVGLSSNGEIHIKGIVSLCQYTFWMLHLCISSRIIRAYSIYYIYMNHLLSFISHNRLYKISMFFFSQCLYCVHSFNLKKSILRFNQRHYFKSHILMNRLLFLSPSKKKER